MSSDGAWSECGEEVQSPDTPATSSTKPYDTCDSDSDDNLEFKYWRAVVDACAVHFENVHRLSGNDLDALREDSTDALPCILMEPRHTEQHKIEFSVVFATRSLARALGTKSSSLLNWTGLSFLRVKPQAADEVVNQKAWSQLYRFQTDFLRNPLCSPPGPLRILILNARLNTTPCWSLLECVAVDLPGSTVTSGRYILYVLRPLQGPVPRALCGKDALKHEECVKMVVSRLRTGICSKCTKGDMGPLSEVAEQTEADLVESLEESQLGDTFVPRLGQEAAQTFEGHDSWGLLLEKMRDQLDQLWQLGPEDCARLEARDAEGLACSVARPCTADCPLVHVSGGFERLTGYSREWALGRNLRFLQPKSRETDLAFNKTQLKRLKQFSQKLQGKLLTIMLQETADDRTFWGLTLVEHVLSETNYLVAVHKELVHEASILDRLVGRVWTEAGAASLELLLLALARREASLLQGRPMHELLWETFHEWLSEASHDVQDWWHGSSFVAPVGHHAVDGFAQLCPETAASGEAPPVVQQALREIAGNAVTDETFGKWLAQASYCIADPGFVDCPLVFVSPGFEADTGFDRGYALGRNCRFLQPTIAALHQALNAQEVGHIARFLSEPRVGGFWASLLLNERRCGQRFWNILCLCCVEIDKRFFILGLQKDMGVPVHTLLETQEASQAAAEISGQEFGLFLAQFGPRLTDLRNQLHRGFEDLGVATARVKEGLVSMLKCLWSSYTDDRRVPRALGARVEIFEQDDLWRAILDAVEPTLLRLYRIDVSDGQSSSCNVACTVADASTADNVLIFISKEFEALTGYQRDWCIGRNCRFLQPPNTEINKLLNESELELVRDWVKGPPEEHSQFTALLVNEAHDECPFWNFLLMESIRVGGQPYIFAVQTSLDVELPNLAELLGMDWLGLKELERLRKKLHGVIALANKSGMTLRETIRDRVVHWVKGLPPVLRLPSITGMGMNVASLELGGRTDFLPAIVDALCEGVRHFTVTFNGADRPQADERMAELEGRLRALRLAEALNGLKKRHLHYLRSAVSFTLVTPVLLMAAFAEFSKAITSSGYALDCWLLDVRGASTAKVQECWRTMSQAKRSRQVGRIGVWGASRQVLEALIEDNHGEKPSVCAVEIYLGKEGDHAHHSLMDYIRKLGLAVLAYHVYGPKNSLLEADFVKAESLRMGVETSILAIKWAEARGCGTVVPKLRSGAVAPEAAPLCVEADGIPVRRTSTERPGGAGMAAGTAFAREQSRHSQRMRNADLLTPTQGNVDQEDGKLHMHRSFVQEYLHAPSAERCAVLLEAAVGAQARDRPRLFSQPSRSMTRQLTRRGSGLTSDSERGLPIGPSAPATMNSMTEQALASRKAGPTRRHTFTGNIVVEHEQPMVRMASERQTPRTIDTEEQPVFRVASERLTQSSPEQELPLLACSLKHRSTLASISVDEAQQPTPRRRSLTALCRPPGTPRAEDPALAMAGAHGPRSPNAARRVSAPVLQNITSSPTPSAASSRISLPPTPSASLRPPQVDSRETPLRELLPEGPELLLRSAVKLQNQGWTLQDIAGLFDLPVQIVVDTLAMGAMNPPGI